MTKLLFWEDPYCKKFSAEVLKVEKGSVVLNQTCFYAESGGQVGDTGLIEDVKVLDTKFAQDKRTVIHIVSEHAKLVVGQKAIGMIDWKRRYTIMRLHSALHITYAVFVKKYGEHRVIGSNISESKARVDFDFHDPVDIEALGNSVSKIVSQGLPIKMEVSKENFCNRFWVVEGFAPIPCGGTHPKNTSEIGDVHLKLKRLGKQGQRIYVSLV